MGEIIEFTNWTISTLRTKKPRTIPKSPTVMASQNASCSSSGPRREKKEIKTARTPIMVIVRMPRLLGD